MNFQKNIVHKVINNNT